MATKLNETTRNRAVNDAEPVHQWLWSRYRIGDGCRSPSEGLRVSSSCANGSPPAAEISVRTHCGVNRSRTKATWPGPDVSASLRQRLQSGPTRISCLRTHQDRAWTRRQHESCRPCRVNRDPGQRCNLTNSTPAPTRRSRRRLLSTLERTRQRTNQQSSHWRHFDQAQS